MLERLGYALYVVGALVGGALGTMIVVSLYRPIFVEHDIAAIIVMFLCALMPYGLGRACLYVLAAK